MCCQATHPDYFQAWSERKGHNPQKAFIPQDSRHAWRVIKKGARRRPFFMTGPISLCLF
ncbi:hypothetical protein TRIP_B50347 [uncultured Desulfatiglans sp.]|uniref:Uncharacterized protein n=1 Tax=Uncultured Desulfatiglans sp. TaxID=1748965 RepID=A0A653AHI4_UNCDX|nr:hypothetical protein TRIP_B50347 [uncultured Desulfatiglans sp.]